MSLNQKQIVDGAIQPAISSSESHGLDLGRELSGPIQTNLLASHPTSFGNKKLTLSSDALAKFPFIK